MKHQELRNLFEKHFSLEGIKKYKNYSVVNEGFPGTFNLSFCEPEVVENFENFVNIKYKLLFMKIQPCIRHGDFLKILTPLSPKSSVYLGVFDMAGICLLSPSSKELKEKTQNFIEKSWDFLVNKIHLNPRNILLKCFSGGNIKQVTYGKYEIDKKIDADKLNISKWIELGIPKENILPDRSRETFLSLYFNKPTPWGYRTEILYKLQNNELLDIGTIEYLLWVPVFKNNKIIDIVPWKNSSCLAVFGLERLNFIMDKMIHIQECDHINPLFKEILSDSKTKDKMLAFLLCECIRTFQRILTDSSGYSNLSRHRKKKLTDYIQQMYKSLDKLEISTKNLKKYLEINAYFQLWYPELKKNVNLVDKELLETFSRKF